MIQLGIDVLQAEEFARLRGKRVGLLTNPSGVNRHLQSTYSIMTQSPHVNMVALFAPEHGIVGAVQAGDKVAHQVDGLTGLPVHSLYGETYRPTPEMLDGIDVLVCDIQDIGLRYYTYTWTLTYVLEAVSATDIELLILDRPHPLGGIALDGGGLDESLRSFVGRFPIPIRHGMTIGELMLMVNAEWSSYQAKIDVVQMKHWRREMLWEETGLHWIPSSPNIPHVKTIWQYIGACLIEGTTLSEGRGTTLPFEVVGAPNIDALALAEALNQQEHEGVYFRPYSFQPTMSKYAGEVCQGVHVHVLDRSLFQPLKVWLAVIETIAELYSDDFAWLPPYINGVQHFDRLIGTEDVRKQIDIRESLDSLFAEWKQFQREFEVKRQDYLLYV